ncbi:MAG: OmpA family protein [Myxococcota bacterium]
MSHKPSSLVIRAAWAAGAAAALGVAQPALAQTAETAGGESIDIELIRPTFGHESFSSVDVPRTAQQTVAFRAGVLLQYQQAPLTLYDAASNEELGAVVANRFSAIVGASLDVDRVTFGVIVPTALNFGNTETPQYEADGFGLGDMGLTARLTWVRTKKDRFNLGTRGGLVLPTGLNNAYMSEEALRFSVGQLAALRLGPLTVATDIGLFTRERRETDEDFVATTDVTWNSAVRFELPDATRLAINGQILARSGLERFLTGPAENGLELLGGVDFYPSRTTTFGIAAGRGLSAGVGTTDFRLLGNLTIQAPERRETVVWNPVPPPAAPPSADAPDPVIQEVIDAPTLIETEEGIVIAIPEQPRFLKDTNTILPESRYIVTEVADLINSTADLAVVKIVGHASQEGSFEYNYRLSESRARRIYELLMEDGVAEQRLAYAGRGEVDPKCGDFDQSDADEEILECNRRVEFIVVKQFEVGDKIPGACKEGEPVKDCYPTRQYLPWGEQVDVVIPAGATPDEDEDEGGDEFGDDLEFDIDDTDDEQEE